MPSDEGMVSPELYQALFPEEDKKYDRVHVIQLEAGKKVQIPIKIHIIPQRHGEKYRLCLSSQMLRYTGLQARYYGFIWKPAAKQLKIGPVVGIMAEKQKNSLKPFRKQTLFFKQIIQESEKCGVLAYIFSPDEAQKNQNESKIKGYIFKNNQWKVKMFPFPDVVYPRHSGYSRYALRIRRQIQDKGAVFINPPLAGKWKTACWLEQYPAMQKYLPETYQLEKFSQVEEFLQHWPAVFLKPVNGAQGKNIIQIERGKREYYFQYQMNQKMYQGRAAAAGELHEKLKRVMQNQTYIIQQYIELVKIHQCVSDIRVIVQKNQYNQWQITGKAFRIGHKGSITSNISAGGYAEKVPKILRKVFSEEQSCAIEKEVDRAALLAVHLLEKGIGTSGEFGVDIGVDQQGKVWFIEANLKPGRQVFSLMGDTEGRRKSVREPLLYARWLAGFEKGKEKIDEEGGSNEKS